MLTYHLHDSARCGGAATNGVTSSFFFFFFFFFEVLKNCIENNFTRRLLYHSLHAHIHRNTKPGHGDTVGEVAERLRRCGNTVISRTSGLPGDVMDGLPSGGCV
jgi:hypothetical protein